MILQQLQLQNFQGAKSYVFNTAGKNTNVYGTNAAGKTTLFNALTWLLFNKSCEDEAGWMPKPIGDDGNEIHNLETSVEGIFIMDDGRKISLKKILSENWQTKRGYSEKSFVGHITNYEIDGVPSTKTEFDIKLDTLIDKKLAMVLCKPNYMAETMHWTERRELLLQVCGDISDEDVLNSSAELTELKEMLKIDGTDGQMHSVDDFKKINAAKLKEVNDKLKEIPTRIDECNNSMPNVSGLSKDYIDKNIAECEDIKNDALKRLSALDTEGSAVQELNIKINQIEAKKAEAKTEYFNKISAEVQVVRSQIRSLESEADSLKSRISNLTSQLSDNKQKLEKMKSVRTAYAAQYNSIKSAEWSGDTVCATCGQPLPEDKIAEAKERFNINKSNELEKLVKTIEKECSKVKIADLEKLIELDGIAKSNANFDLDEINTKIKAISIPNHPGFETTDECKAFDEQITVLKKQIVEDDAEDMAKIEIKAQITTIDNNINSLKRQLLDIESKEKLQERISQLESEEQALGTELEKINKGIYLSELFVKSKVKMLDDNINSRFNNVRFKLFDVQINGGIKETCEVLIPTATGLVPFSTANNAAKINAGLEIINTLSMYFKTSMPVFVDNAESVVNLIKIEPQVIRLIVSESDPVLRVEVE